jgi:hypothetical protein
VSITVILNAYRRPHTIAKQIQSIQSQSIKPDEIWLWRNFHEDFKLDISEIDGIDKYCDSNYNWKYFGRFAFAMLAQTEFVAFFDDDTIPGNNWFKNCIDNFNKKAGVLGGVGLIQKDQKNYMNHTRYGWPSLNEETVRVDLVGHAWFVHRDFLRSIWLEPPATFETAEDMHLSYCCQKYLNIDTFVPPHPKSDSSMSSSLFGYELGVDSTTDSVTNHGDFFKLRDSCLQEYVKRGWKLICS